MILRKSVVTGLVATLGLGAMAIAASHGGEGHAAAMARKAHMNLYAHNLGILGKMAKGETAFDAAASQAAADNLASLSTLNQMTYWVPGSSDMDIGNTRALPALWDNIPDAIAKGEALAKAAMAMQAAAGSLEGVQGNIGAVGGACGACHKAYRAPES